MSFPYFLWSLSPFLKLWRVLISKRIPPLIPMLEATQQIIIEPLHLII